MAGPTTERGRPSPRPDPLQRPGRTGTNRRRWTMTSPPPRVRLRSRVHLLRTGCFPRGNRPRRTTSVTRYRMAWSRHCCWNRQRRQCHPSMSRRVSRGLNLGWRCQGRQQEQQEQLGLGARRPARPSSQLPLFDPRRSDQERWNSRPQRAGPSLDLLLFFPRWNEREWPPERAARSSAPPLFYLHWSDRQIDHSVLCCSEALIRWWPEREAGTPRRSAASQTAR